MLTKNFIVLLLTLSLVTVSAQTTKKPAVPIPTKTAISRDLVGRRITEGRDNGYFAPDWSWTIESGEISNLKIESTKTESDYCSFVVTMTLKSQSCPTKFSAKVQMEYTLSNKSWHLYMVNSKGVSIIKTGRYKDCISTKIDDDGWGGVNCLKIKNNTDSSLIVGGEYITTYSTEWHKFSVVVPGLKVMGVGGTLGGGSVSDYHIHFVEPY